MCVELLREVLTSLKCVLIASACITAAKDSQLKGWKQHKTACDAIIQLKVDKSASACKTGIYNTPLPPSEQDQVLQLIGEKCQVACKMNDVVTQVLLVTGAQVSLLSHTWLESNLPGAKILEVGELLDPCDRLRVQWDNQTEISFLGWIDIKFELSDESSSTVEELQVPFLVIKEPLDNPILGFNFIKVLVDNTSNDNALINSVQSNLKNIKSNNIKAPVNLISQSTDYDEFLVQSMPSITIVPTRKLINIQCKVNLGNINNKIPMLFEREKIELPEGLETVDTIVSVKSGMNHCLKIPVVKKSKHDIFLPKNTIIGRLQQISHITPVEVKERKADISTVQSSLNKDEMEMEEEQGNNDMTAVEIIEHQQKVLDSIVLSGLNPEKRREVQQLITREADIFSVIDSDIGNIISTQMEIKPQDETPVQLNYHSVPKPLYAELKAHIENTTRVGLSTLHLHTPRQ